MNLGKKKKMRKSTDIMHATLKLQIKNINSQKLNCFQISMAVKVKKTEEIVWKVACMNNWVWVSIRFVYLRNIWPSECVEPAEDVHLGLFRAGFHATLTALHQARCDGAAGSILQEWLTGLLQLGNGGFDKGTGHVKGCWLRIKAWNYILLSLSDGIFSFIKSMSKKSAVSAWVFRLTPIKKQDLKTALEI